MQREYAHLISYSPAVGYQHLARGRSSAHWTEKAHSSRRLQGGEARPWYIKSPYGCLENSGLRVSQEWRSLEYTSRMGVDAKTASAVR